MGALLVAGILHSWAILIQFDVFSSYDALEYTSFLKKKKNRRSIRIYKIDKSRLEGDFSLIITVCVWVQTPSPLFVRSLVRLVGLLVSRPAASMATILHYSRALPRNRSLERLVRYDLLDDVNYLFQFLISVLRCFW